MKALKGKTLLSAIALGITMSVYGMGYAAPLETNTVVQVDVQQTVRSVVNWEKGQSADIEAVGIGLPPTNMIGTRGAMLARRAAVVDAYRQLAEAVNGVRVDADTTMRDLVIESDVVRTQTQALIKGARIIEEHANADGSYSVKLMLPLYGGSSVAAVAVPQMRVNEFPAPQAAAQISAENKVSTSALGEAAATASKAETLPTEQATPKAETPKADVAVIPAPKVETKESKQAAPVITDTYTGVIIDAAGLGLEGTFSPLIYDTNGRTIYGMRNIDKEYAISHGMVEYSSNLQNSISNSRAGSKPLVVKAVSVKGGNNSVNRVNVVVSADDAEKILAANAKAAILDNRAVVFVK